MKKIKILLFIILILGIASCRQSPMKKYESLMAKEASRKKVNDVFFGIYLGMTSKDFYVHCWNLNKKGLFTDGLSNTSVCYKLKQNELKHPADLNFYPAFSNGKISSVWARFQYAGWAPWNKKLDADDLIIDVVSLYKKWYPGGNDFIKIEDEKKGTIYVKVDGNRRIIIGQYDDVQVKVDYTDLSAGQQSIK